MGSVRQTAPRAPREEPFLRYLRSKIPACSHMHHHHHNYCSLLWNYRRSRIPSHLHLLCLDLILFLSSARLPASNQHGLPSLFKCNYYSSYHNINKCSLIRVHIPVCVCVCVCAEAKGWAVESRVYAEDPYRGFLPSIGPLVTYKEPTLEVNNAGACAPTYCQCLCMHVRVTDWRGYE